MTEDWPRHRDVLAPHLCDGWTVEAFLRARFDAWPPEDLRRGIAAGEVCAPDGAPLRGDDVLRTPVVLRVSIPGIAPDVAPPPFPTILHEDDRVIAVHKPAGLMMHPSGQRFAWALVGMAKRRWPRDAIDLVHRLDRDTSGVVVLTKDKDANRILKAALRDGLAEKVYVARVRGRPAWDRATVDHPIGRADGPIRIQMAARPDGLAARTDLDVLARDGARPEALVRCRPRTGRTHQLRVHLARVGHPILGDLLYGTDASTFLRSRDPGGEAAARIAAAAPRLLLHALRLMLPHPDGGALSVCAPLPAALAVRCPL